jgi:hypothetical protein
LATVWASICKIWAILSQSSGHPEPSPEDFFSLSSFYFWLKFWPSFALRDMSNFLLTVLRNPPTGSTPNDACFFFFF